MNLDNLAEMSRAPSNQLRSSLFTIPTEIRLLILDCLYYDVPALKSLAQTCKAMQPLAEALLYTEIVIHDLPLCSTLIKSFKSRPDRATTVESISLLLPYEKLRGTRHIRKDFLEWLSRMKSLKDLDIESPYDNWRRWLDGPEWVEQDMEQIREALETSSLLNMTVLFREDMEHIRDALETSSLLNMTVFFREDIGMQHLQFLKINGHGGNTDMWPLKNFSCIFLLPSLIELKIACVEITGTIKELEPFQRTTPLQRLIFEESNLTPAALSSILATPKALEELTLGENIHNIGSPPFRSLGSSESQILKTMDAISKVAGSLSCLVHEDRGCYPLEPMNLRGPGLRNFHRLIDLRCSKNSFLFRYIAQSFGQAPMNLQHLTLIGHRPKGRQIEIMENPVETSPLIRLPDLVKVTLQQDLALCHPSLGRRLWRPERTRKFHEWACELHTEGIRTVLDIRVITPNYYPPYAYNEPEPFALRVYDSIEISEPDYRQHWFSFPRVRKVFGKPPELWIQPVLHLRRDLTQAMIEGLASRTVFILNKTTRKVEYWADIGWIFDGWDDDDEGDDDNDDHDGDNGGEDDNEEDGNEEDENEEDGNEEDEDEDDDDIEEGNEDELEGDPMDVDDM